MNDELLDKIRTFLTEAFLHKRAIVVAYTIISLTILAIGLKWPQDYYVSRSTIIVDDNSVIKPLMEGTAVPTDISAYATLAQELIFSRKIMDKVLENYLVDSHQLPLSIQDKIIDEIEKGTKVSTMTKDFITIDYRDKNPKNAMKIAQLLADLYIQEIYQLKIKEGNSAYEFIDKQVQQYHQALTEAQEKLQAWHNSNITILSGMGREPNENVSRITSQIDEAEKELAEKKLIKESLEKQLAGESGVIEYLTLEDPYVKRLADLQTQLDTLRLSYHDNYPDIVQIRHQIEDLKEILNKGKNDKNNTGIKKENQTKETALLNPIAKDLRLELYRTESRILILNNAIDGLKRKKKEAIAMSYKINEIQTKQAELQRTYDVNFSVYQELIKKKEQARVSMSLDVKSQGNTLRVYTPAFLPSKPSGLRFLYFFIGSQLLGIALPLSILFIKITFDKKIRSEMIISDQLNLPLLAVIPHIYTPRESLLNKINFIFVLTLIMFNASVLLAIVVLKHETL